VFVGTDVIDLTDVLPGLAKPLVYNGTAASGVLTAGDGSHTANITLIGSYSAADFHLAGDGAAGSLISFVRPDDGMPWPSKHGICRLPATEPAFPARLRSGALRAGTLSAGFCDRCCRRGQTGPVCGPDYQQVGEKINS
jgi:hypothetical protein